MVEPAGACEGDAMIVVEEEFESAGGCVLCFGGDLDMTVGELVECREAQQVLNASAFSKAETCLLERLWQ